MEDDVQEDVENVPKIIAFAYYDYTRDIVKYKYSAKCNICKAKLVDRIGVSSAFTK